MAPSSWNLQAKGARTQPGTKPNRTEPNRTEPLEVNQAGTAGGAHTTPPRPAPPRRPATTIMDRPRPLRAAAAALVLLACAVAPASAVWPCKEEPEPEPEPEPILHDLPTVGDAVEIIEYFEGLGAVFSGKQEVRRLHPDDELSPLGVFANETISEGEILLSVPWNLTIGSGKEWGEGEPKTLQCDTISNLALAMAPSENTTKGPYAQYLRKYRRADVPSGWSSYGKDKLNELLDFNVLPPLGGPDKTQEFWINKAAGCPGYLDPLSLHAANLVFQFAHDDIMVPMRDLYNHQSGPLLGVDSHRVDGDRYTLTARRDIAEGEEIFFSHNTCNECQNKQMQEVGTAGEKPTACCVFHSFGRLGMGSVSTRHACVCGAHVPFCSACRQSSPDVVLVRNDSFYLHRTLLLSLPQLVIFIV